MVVPLLWNDCFCCCGMIVSVVVEWLFPLFGMFVSVVGNDCSVVGNDCSVVGNGCFRFCEWLFPLLWNGCFRCCGMAVFVVVEWLFPLL